MFTTFQTFWLVSWFQGMYVCEGWGWGEARFPSSSLVLFITIGDFGFEYEYENDVSVLVCGPHIFTSHTYLNSEAALSTKTNMKSEDSGNVTGLKFENCTSTKPRTRSPIQKSLMLNTTTLLINLTLLATLWGKEISELSIQHFFFAGLYTFVQTFTSSWINSLSTRSKRDATVEGNSEAVLYTIAKTQTTIIFKKLYSG